MSLFLTKKPMMTWRTASNKWAEPRSNRKRGASDNLNVSPLTSFICRPTPLWIRTCNPNRVVLHPATRIRHLCLFEYAVLTWWGEKTVLLPIDNCPYVSQPSGQSRKAHLAHSRSSPCRYRSHACMSEVPLQPG